LGLGFEHGCGLLAAHLGLVLEVRLLAGELGDLARELDLVRVRVGVRVGVRGRGRGRVRVRVRVRGSA